MNKFNFIKYSVIAALIFINACGKIHTRPDGAVVAFIIAAEQRDMSKAWNILSPELQAYYNSLGEKMRKSGKGALENEIARITKFRTVKKDYLINQDSINNTVINIVTLGGSIHKIETVEIGGDFKIKDEAALKNLLEGISAERKEKDAY